MKNLDQPLLKLSMFLAISFFLLLVSCSPNAEDALPNQKLTAADLTAPVNFTSWQDQIDWLTQKTTRFHNFKVAIAQGWNTDATGYIPHMGSHYINMAYADGTFELGNPEVLMYAPNADGDMVFVGVEYLAFVEDPANPGSPPEGFIGNEDVWVFNTDVNAWTLHAWVGVSNPDGVFAAFNPLVD